MTGDRHPREMTARRFAAEQNSAYDSTTLSRGHQLITAMKTRQRFSGSMPPRAQTPDGRPYPVDWENVADLRVLRTGEENWQQMIRWRTEMGRQGWRMLRVTAADGELVVVFGRTKDTLLNRSEDLPSG